MTEASYFDLKSKIFNKRTGSKVPIFSGTPINWGNSWMMPLEDFILQRSKSDITLLSKPTENPKIQKKRVFKHIKTQEFVPTEELMDDIKDQLSLSPEFVICNWPDLKKANEIKNNDWWVWAGFVKPGKHNVVVKGLSQGFYRRNIAVSVREGELAILPRAEDKLQHKFCNDENNSESPLLTSPDFMFKVWKKDTEKLDKKAFMLDQKFCHLPKILNKFPPHEER